jgi:hypothetical protein
LVILFSRVQAHFIFKGSGPFQVSTLLGGEIKQMKKWQQQKLGDRSSAMRHFSPIFPKKLSSKIQVL